MAVAGRTFFKEKKVFFTKKYFRTFYLIFFSIYLMCISIVHKHYF